MMVPSLGDSISEGTLIEWKKRIGDVVEADNQIAMVETDKVTVDINSTLSGKIVKMHANEGDVVFVGKPFIDVDTNPDQSELGAVEAPEASQEKKQVEKELPPKDIPKFTRVPLSRMRLKIGERLKHAQNSAVMLTTFNECDMGNLMDLRAQLNSSGKLKCKLGFVSAFMKAASMSLEKMPIMNSYIDGTDIVQVHQVDISVAVSTPTGLLVPVIRNCQDKSWEELEMELVKAAANARSGQMQMSDMEGGTFTISNGGVYGSMLSTPILNPPQTSILGMHNITKRVVVNDDKMVIRPMMYLALSYDHRLVDGSDAVQFLLDIKNNIQDPSKLGFIV
ncbi:bifunctional Biotin-lipoyl attachment/Chloramphenicol acetyltransferase-like domain superfamily/Single hybrid motif/2-oxo acid dehydrogenase [Babesia duncani]|uniref:Dihydrolipoamide acetyltransferase component of pyruvate dehydrogenase complex n=1 Tax=Babesia duncani TaxID=323732 RepID=A0AAD9PM01_9APIC|nr:bifunctional Biotin-lipoyl attachment/Chloramphenicol acetyltransferase-like domain superfamily/Single hybrid motif/2-oxo acid dehydrogenase [Babesia duncani]